MRRDEMQNILNSASVLSELPDSKAIETVQDLLKHPGIPLILGLMLGQRQGLFMMLSEAPLTNMETVARAAVIQGTIKGIEAFGNTLLEQSVPSDTDEQEQN